MELEKGTQENSVPVKVSGGIINELSSKIPSNIFALNELVKNAYDAFSEKVVVSMDFNKEIIEITDTGNGMNRQAIENLFHIASSKKKYGEQITQNNVTRYVQGSKGLGFLAAFKFGNKVKWETNSKDIKYVFEVLKTEITDMDNITDYEVYIQESPSATVGTKITVFSNKDTIEELVDYFEEDKNSLKLVGSFPKEVMKVELHLPGGKKVRSENIPDLHSINPKCQLFYIKYDSHNGSLKFYNRGGMVREEIFELSSNDYFITADIIVYSLSAYGKKNISEYYHRESDGSLTPLLFVNDNLFNNFTLYDPNVFRQRKSGSSLPQMIGQIRIYSKNSKIDFNSDRTNFVENNTTKFIAKDLRKLNEFIQETGSQIKKSLELEKDGNITGKAKPQQDNPHDKNDDLLKLPKLKPAYILIDENKIEQYIHSPQFDIFTLIKEAKNSLGEDILLELISVTLDDSPLESTIISSVDKPCEFMVKFFYSDEKTGNVFASTTLKFIQRKLSLTADKEDVDLFWFESNTPYNVKIPVVTTLLNQISRAHKYKGQYTALIACSLRAIFEISIDRLKKKHKYIFNHTKTIKAESTKWDVMQVIAFIKKNNTLRTDMAKAIDIEYTTLTNLLDMTGYCEAIEGAHLGAHKSTSHLTNSRIENIAKYASNFSVFCDCLINNFTESTIKKYVLAEDSYFS